MSLLLLLLVGGGADARAQSIDGDRVLLSQLVVRERVVVRVRTPAQAMPKIKWNEKKGPRCMSTDMIAGAAVTENDSVDFALKGGTRMRAKLDDDCPALDYYGGFYIAPTKDRKICAGRDAIHARSGGLCEIVRFRTLVAVSGKGR